MLPVYEAIGFEKVMLGGTTRPWLVNVLENGKPVPYVVKLYTEKYNEENCSVLKEAICSYLASEFEIQVPEPALINFSQDFLVTLPIEQRRELEKKDGQYLVTLNVETKRGVFDTFQTYLETMVSLDGLEAIYGQLERLGHPIDD